MAKKSRRLNTRKNAINSLNAAMQRCSGETVRKICSAGFQIIDRDTGKNA